MSIVFSGSRYGMSAEQIVTLHVRLEELAPKGEINLTSFRHGMSGDSDKIAHYVARANDYYIIGHPCNLEKWRINVTVDEMREMKDPLDRNQDMIDEALAEISPIPARLIATPNTDIKPDGRLPGTWSTICRAVNSGLLIEIIQLNGKIRGEI